MQQNQSPTGYSLKFLSGKCQGTEYRIGERGGVVIGRSTDADLTLLEGMVSRLHARFSLSGRDLIVEDLGSTNGTFVNGERIRERTLIAGDRVLIGNSILKVQVAGSKPAVRVARQAGDINADAQTRRTVDMDGEVGDVSVLELVEMYGGSERESVIELQTPEGIASMTIAHARVEQCQVECLPDAPAAKRLLRFLSYNTGKFRIRPYVAPSGTKLNGSVAELLVEARHLLNELTILLGRLPSRPTPLVLAKPILAKLSDLGDVDLDLLQLAHNSSSLEQVLNGWHETDVKAARRLLALVDGGYLRRG